MLVEVGEPSLLPLLKGGLSTDWLEEGDELTLLRLVKPVRGEVVLTALIRLGAFDPAN